MTRQIKAKTKAQPAPKAQDYVAIEKPDISVALAAAPKPETKAQELIRLAKANLTKKRWIKDALIDGPNACLVGGFRKVKGYGWLTEERFAYAGGSMRPTAGAYPAGPGRGTGEAQWIKPWSDKGNLTIQERRCEAAPYVEQAVQELFPERGSGSAHGFNDHPKTTHEDVMAVLDRAYELAGSRKKKKEPRK